MGTPQKPRKSRKVTELDAFAHSSMSSLLFQQITEAVSGTPYKHEYFDQVINAFLEARATGEIPRVYIGNPNAGNRTIYLRQQTLDAIKAITGEDGVTVSDVIRTAFAWSLHHETNPDDPWGTESTLGPKS